MFIGFILTRAENAASPAPADSGAKTVSREARCAVPGLADIRPYEDGEGPKGPSRSARHGRGVLTPYAGMTLGDAGSRTVRAGTRWQLARDAVLGLEGTRQTSDAGGADNQMMLRIALRF